MQKRENLRRIDDADEDNNPPQKKMNTQQSTNHQRTPKNTLVKARAQIVGSETRSCDTRVPRPWGAIEGLEDTETLETRAEDLGTPAERQSTDLERTQPPVWPDAGRGRDSWGEKAGKLKDLEGARKLGHNCEPQLFRRWAVTFGVQKPIFSSRLATKHTPRWWV